MSNLVIKALRIAMDAHKDQTDKAGKPYILHPLAVAISQKTEECTIAALLHDVVEDSDYTFSDLESEGFSKEVLSALKLLTHDKFVDYGEYISSIRDNEIARNVKIADLTHNSDLARLAIVTDNDIERCEKYKKALRYLREYPALDIYNN